MWELIMHALIYAGVVIGSMIVTIFLLNWLDGGDARDIIDLFRS